jgi:hypothetical protein
MVATSFNKAMHDKATETSVLFAKMQCAGHFTAIEKSGWIDIINRHSTALYGDASPRNFTKTITEDENGRLFYQALKFAEGSEIKPKPVEAPQPPEHIGPHHARLHVEATARQRERGITYAAAVSEVVNADPALSAAVRDEHLQHALGAMSGAGGVTGTMDIGQAQRMEPAKDFSATGTGDYSRQVARKNAEAELQRLADQRHAAHPEEKASTSYSKVLMDAGNAALRRVALAVA